MKILHCVWAMRGGGAERQLSYLAPALANRRHDVHMALVFPGVNSDPVQKSMCSLHHIRAAGKYDPRVATRLLHLVRRLKPDVVHTWMTQMDILGGSTASCLGIPWILSERSVGLNYPRSVLHTLRVATGRRATSIVANSLEGAHYWQSHGVPAHRIEVIPNCVPVRDIDAADPVVDDRVAPNEDVLLVVGRLSHEKNLDRLVTGLRELAGMRSGWKVVFCGDGPLADVIQQQVRDAGLVERVVFAGFVSNIASWLKRSRALVAVSLWEGHPNAVLEAMAATTPIVASDITSFRSLLDDESAWFAPANDPSAIARTLDRVLASPEEASRRARNAKARLHDASLDVTVTRYEDAYCRAVRTCRSTAHRMKLRRQNGETS
jgi:glycosyltransferase involved in cell wall biosynthesis